MFVSLSNGSSRNRKHDIKIKNFSVDKWSRKKNELENKLIEIIQSGKGRKKNKKSEGRREKRNITLKTHGIISFGLAYLQIQSQKVGNGLGQKICFKR